MFGIAFVWGLGASLGGIVGIIVLIVLWRLVDRVIPANMNARDINRQSLQSLLIRNELTIDTNRHLNRIAETLEEATDRVEIDD